MLSRLRRLASAGRRLPEPLAFPPPYRGMLAINSDVEWTRWPAQIELLEEFAGLGLETAFSYWFFADQERTWSLFEEDGRPGRHYAAALPLLLAGLLDTVHGFGGRRHGRGTRYTRAAIAAGYAALTHEGVHPSVFSNHGSQDDRQNVGGSWATYQEGDLPGSELYHLDLTVANGVRFFWCDPDYEPDRAGLPARAGDDGLFRAQDCRDGRRILRFRRYLGRLSAGCALDNLAEQLGPLVATPPPGYTILYQHLGVERLPDGKPTHARSGRLPAPARAALEALAARQAAGEILFTTTARLLRHALLMAARPWRIERQGRCFEVRFEREFEWLGSPQSIGWSDLDGWTLPVGHDEDAVAILGGESRPLAVTSVGESRLAGRPWPRIDMHAAVAHARELAR